MRTINNEREEHSSCVMSKYVNTVERINAYRWNTEICVELKCGIDYTKEQYEQIKQDILEIVNNCSTNTFHNNCTGEKTYKYVNYLCECNLDKNHKEHFCLHNQQLDKEWD